MGGWLFIPILTTRDCQIPIPPRGRVGMRDLSGTQAVIGFCRVQSASAFLLYGVAPYSGTPCARFNLGKASTSGRVWPTSSCPLVPARQAVFRGLEVLGGPHPPLWRISRTLNFLLARGGWRGRGECQPPPPPAQVSARRQSVPPASSHHCHRPSRHHPSLFPWAWLSLAEPRHSPQPLVVA